MDIPRNIGHALMFIVSKNLDANFQIITNDRRHFYPEDAKLKKGSDKYAYYGR